MLYLCGMSRLIRLFTLLILLLSCWPITGQSGALEDGHAAYQAKRYTQAFHLWEPLAQNGDMDAQYNLGLLYMKGLGVGLDERKALEWFHKSAHQGNTDAMYNIGVMFYEGKGAYRSDQSAVEWWKLAADGGNPNGQYNLGVMYAFGIGIGQDTNKAVSLWEAAAKQGHPDAIEMLIRAYHGKVPGSKIDAARAKYWEAIQQQHR